jgi:O-antigen/teichoic acid export membrane protein
VSWLQILPKSSHREGTPTGTKIIRNVAFGVLRVLLVAPIPLFLTPFIIKHVGAKGLGLWAVFLAVNGLTSLADLGFLGTLTKHVSEHFAKQDYMQLNRVLNAGLIIFAGAALFFAVVLNLGSSLIISAFLQQAPLPWVELQRTVRMLSIAVSFNLLTFPFSSIIVGLQRLDFANLISALSTVGIALFAAFSLASGFGITGLAWSIVLGAGANFGLSVAAAWSLLPQFRISPGLVRRKDVKDLSAFSVKMYVTQVAVLVHNHTEKFLLAHFSGLTSAGWYDVANDLSVKARGIPSLLLSPLLPAASELQARGDQPKTVQLYQRSQKYLAVVGVLISIITAVLAHRFVQVWLGPSFAAVAAALIILTVVQFINLASGPGLFIFIGKGELHPGVRSAVVGIVLNVALSTIFIMRFGFTGAVFGTALSLSVASIYFIIMFHQKTGYPISLVLSPYAKPLSWGVFLAFVAKESLPIDRLGWAGMTITALVLAAAYLGGLVVVGYFDAFDMRAIRQVLELRKAFRRTSDIA